MSSLGHFSADGATYHITSPRTPRPWHNYIYNDSYLANLTQHATGASFWQPLSEGLRVNVTEDRDGNGGPRFIYLRDDANGDYWTVTGAPDYPEMDAWECVVGQGYQINKSTYKGISASWRMFVPQTKDRVEIWSLTVRNNDPVERTISVFPYVEMHLTGGSTLMDFIAVLGGRFDAQSNAVFGINSCVKFPDDFKAFLASDTPVDGCTVSRDEFLGTYRDYRNPIAVESGEVDNREAGTEWIGASLRNRLKLAPGEEKTLHFALGVMATPEEGREVIQRVLAKGAPDRLFAELEEITAALRERHKVQTPDPQFDLWVNSRLKHQLHFVARWGRVIGRGYRDILQDTFGHTLSDPEKSRACILETFAKQFPSGRCIRAWRLPTAQLDLQHYADSPSWMIMALALYLKETGDFQVLEEVVPYLNEEDPYAPSTASGTVWDHVLLAQRHLLEHRGSHGLSKIYYGDWCDTMNGVGAKGRGESVMLSMQVKWGCDLLAELAGEIGQADVAAEMQKGAAELTEAIHAHCWDGQWYVRAFDDEGIPVGSDTPPPSDEGEGRIFLNPQSWSLISGVASPEKGQSAVDQALKHLDVGYGMVLNWPAFTSLKPRIGQMTAMTPGFYENASVYVHGNCFWIYALAASGRGDLGWKALQAILPDTPNKPNSDTEPFVIPNYYIGPNVTRRRERNLYLSGWRTGSASWLYLTAMQKILGVEADYQGLRINPSLPEGWKEARVLRSFRGDTYAITLLNPSGQGRHVKVILLDGQPVEGNLIPVVGDGAIHEVSVELTEN